jgi:anaerobic selenocysteine-containing dehydrogenase
MATTTKTFCRLCEVACGLVAQVEDGRIGLLDKVKEETTCKMWPIGSA